MEHVTSVDGTAIAVAIDGQGPPLVLVHGGSADHRGWDLVAPSLAERFTTHRVDRRGRGESGDRSEAGGDDLAREVEDILAVIESAGAPAHLLGHSGGAVCALQAALEGAPLRSLVLYEPPIFVPPHRPPGLADRLQASADAGDLEGLLLTFLREGPRVPEAEIEALRASPGWQARVANAPRILREARLVETYRPEEQRLRAFDAPTLLLLGTNTAPHHAAATEFLAATLPNARVVALEGEGHVAMNTAPKLFAREVLAFLSDVA